MTVRSDASAVISLQTCKRKSSLVSKGLMLASVHAAVCHFQLNVNDGAVRRLGSHQPANM
jgi:hypothetical protein